MELQIENDTTESLPLEMLLDILLNLKNEKDLLSARAVNRTWYHLITGNEKMLTSIAKDRLEKIVQSVNMNILPTIPNNTYTQLISTAKRISAKLNHPRTERAKITLKSQFTSDVILECGKKTVSAIGDSISRRLLFGDIITPTPTKALLALCFYILATATLVHLLNNILNNNSENNFLDTVALVAYHLPNRLIQRYKNPALFTFVCLFFKKLYENYQNSLETYKQEIGRELQITDTDRISSSSPISVPIQYLTISWNRENLLSTDKTEHRQTRDAVVEDHTVMKHHLF